MCTNRQQCASRRSHIIRWLCPWNILKQALFEQLQRLLIVHLSPCPHSSLAASHGASHCDLPFLCSICSALEAVLKHLSAQNISRAIRVWCAVYLCLQGMGGRPLVATCAKDLRGTNWLLCTIITLTIVAARGFYMHGRKHFTQTGWQAHSAAYGHGQLALDYVSLCSGRSNFYPPADTCLYLGLGFIYIFVSFSGS